MSKFSLLILSAGFGKRMLDLTTNQPKPLLKIKNTTLLGNAINFFQSIGCNEIFINTHYLHNKIEEFIHINHDFNFVKLIYEPYILGTGGAVKNIFNYTTNKNICVVNSDIFWADQNKLEIINFLKDFNEITNCKILLSKNCNFHGLKNKKGDFNIQHETISNWFKGNEIFFYSGIQVVSKNIFQKFNKIFSMNDVWQNLINNKNLKGGLIESEILHIGDKYSFDNL